MSTVSQRTTTLHGIAEACLRHPNGGFVRCYCTAWFSSPLLSEAAEAYRNHMAEPALPQRAEEGT